jgi:hypothetical protein
VREGGGGRGEEEGGEGGRREDPFAESITSAFEKPPMKAIPEKRERPGRG